VREPTRILAVDDQPENLELLGAILGEEGFDVTFAADGAEALAAVEERLPHAILLDLMMPNVDGLEVCRRLKGKRPTCFVPIILLTALTDVESRVRGLDAGADDFLNKPFRRAELLTRLQSLLRIRRLRDDLDSTESVIFSMVDLLEGKDPKTRHHSLRVAALAGATASRLGLDERSHQDLVWGGLLHDLGKLGVPEAILRLDGGERDAEQERLYREHPALGARILRPIDSLAGPIRLVEHHHERLDGTGYPRGLSGDDFDPALELLAVANRFDYLRRRSDDDAGRAGSALLAEAEAGRYRLPTAQAIVAEGLALDPEPALTSVLPVPATVVEGTILVGDDSVTNRNLYRELLEMAGHTVVTVESGDAVLERWREVRPDLVLLDVRMPGVTGDEVCRLLKSDPDATWLPVLLVTAYEARESRQRALDAGADDLLFAPVHRTELLARVRSLLRLRLFHADLVEHEAVVLSLSTALEAKDPYTRGHSTRVGELSARLALELGEDDDTAERLRLGGLLHDIGKVAVPEAVLTKPGRLTDEEMAAVMTHPVVGWEICRRLRSAEPVLDVIRFHHERNDGSGYPEGLAGDDIPWHARILSVADAMDALTSERPYRRSLGVDEALGLLREERDRGKWDPRLIEAIARLHDKGAADPRAEAVE